MFRLGTLLVLTALALAFTDAAKANDGSIASPAVAAPVSGGPPMAGATQAAADGAVVEAATGLPAERVRSGTDTVAPSPDPVAVGADGVAARATASPGAAVTPAARVETAGEIVASTGNVGAAALRPAKQVGTPVTETVAKTIAPVAEKLDRVAAPVAKRAASIVSRPAAVPAPTVTSSDGALASTRRAAPMGIQKAVAPTMAVLRRNSVLAPADVPANVAAELLQSEPGPVAGGQRLVIATPTGSLADDVTPVAHEEERSFASAARELPAPRDGFASSSASGTTAATILLLAALAGVIALAPRRRSSIARLPRKLVPELCVLSALERPG